MPDSPRHPTPPNSPNHNSVHKEISPTEREFGLKSLEPYNGPLDIALDTSAAVVASSVRMPTLKSSGRIGKNAEVQDRRIECLHIGSCAIGKEFLLDASAASRRLYSTQFFTKELNLLDHVLTAVERVTPNYLLLLRLLWNLRRRAEDFIRLSGESMPQIPSWADDANILHFYNGNDFEILGVSFRAEVESFLVLLDKIFDFSKNEARNSMLLDTAPAFTKRKSTTAVQPFFQAQPSTTHAAPASRSSTSKHTSRHSTGVPSEKSVPAVIASLKRSLTDKSNDRGLTNSKTADHADLGNKGSVSNLHSRTRGTNQSTHPAANSDRSSYNNSPHLRVSQFGHNAVSLHRDLRSELFAPIGPIGQTVNQFTAGTFYDDSSDSDSSESRVEMSPSRSPTPSASYEADSEQSDTSSEDLGSDTESESANEQYESDRSSPDSEAESVSAESEQSDYAVSDDVSDHDY
ncbi:hypothetical protein C8R43DRAFT_1103183 [Mycena crocata]|nr:hypothetical protein C8R43DRAFT_1103183 [Mycena crocata]